MTYSLSQRSWRHIVDVYGREYNILYYLFKIAKTKSHLGYMTGVWARTSTGFHFLQIQEHFPVFTHDPFPLQTSWDAEKTMKNHLK